MISPMVHAQELPPLDHPMAYLPEIESRLTYMVPTIGIVTSGYGWQWGEMHSDNLLTRYAHLNRLWVSLTNRVQQLEIVGA